MPQKTSGCVSASIAPQNALLRLGELSEHIPAPFLLSLGFLPDPQLALAFGWDASGTRLPWEVDAIPGVQYFLGPFQPLWPCLFSSTVPHPLSPQLMSCWPLLVQEMFKYKQQSSVYTGWQWCGTPSESKMAVSTQEQNQTKPNQTNTLSLSIPCS